jgi:hypothetical protein
VQCRAKSTGTSEKLPAFVQRVRIAPGGSSKVAIRLQRGMSIRGTVLYSDGPSLLYVALTPEMKLRGGGFGDVLGVGPTTPTARAVTASMDCQTAPMS